MVYFLFTLLILPTLVTATPSKIFTQANDGAVLAGHPTLTCQSCDCRAIQTNNIDICMTQTCRAIVGDSEYACTYWDCNLVVYARKHGPLPRALAEALCVTPNCIAIVTQNPNEAQDVDGMIMVQFYRDTGSGCFPKQAAPLIKEWQASTYYDPANLKESFRLFYTNKVAQIKQEVRDMLRDADEPETYPTTKALDNYNSQRSRPRRTCHIPCPIL